MRFIISIRSYGRNYRLRVERLQLNERTEQYKVIGRNKSILLESNRPFFRNRGLKHRKPDWKVIGEQPYYGKGLEDVIEAIMKVIDKP